MKSRLLLLSVPLTLVGIFVSPLIAEEPYLDFLQGLRERQYFDYAILYLDQIAQRPSLPAEMRPLVVYEKAVTLREYAKVLRSPAKQNELLNQSLAYLEQFAKDFPNHPNSADANSDRAQILLQKAEVEIFQSKSPSNKGSKIEFQKKGREYVQKARDVLKVAHDQHEAAFKKFPAFIDEVKEPKLKAERSRVETSLLIESLNLAKCTYQEAETHDAGSREFKQLMSQAADEFEKVYIPHRSQLGGLHARAWQGKCYEEQGDFQKALGIYNELLDHPGDDAGLQSLMAQTLLFKLICLAARDDNQLVVDLAEEWLKKNGTESKTSVGLGIQWEQARAYEALGDNRNLTVDDQRRLWRQARTAAQQISRYPGEYKDVSMSMIQRLQVKVGGKEQKPDNFETAFGLGNTAFKNYQEVKKELDGAAKAQRPPEEITRLKQDSAEALNEAARNLELAMQLANRRDNPKDVATSRLLLAYTFYYLHRNYEAAILAQYVARTTTDDESSIALDSAHMAMAAYIQAYNDNKVEAERKADDMQLIIKAANFIISRWPESDKANEARMILGGMYTQAKKPAEAADWYSKIPESDPKYAEAQLAAGQAYWIAYGSAGRLAPEARPSQEKLVEWKGSAEKYLRTGIAKLSASLPKEGAVPAELVSAKIYLAEILLSQGKEADAVKMLLDDPQSVAKAIAVPDEAQRPLKGIQSRQVAKSVYRLLLRAYIGMGPDKLNDARTTMKTLEGIAAGDHSSDLTDLYVDLGKGLKNELERFRSNGETERFNKLMEAFESFLDDVNRQEGQTLGSLSWIGETYLTLGEISNDAAKIASFYSRASSALNQILTRSQNDANFVTPEQLLNVKVRLIHCNRLKKDFETGEQMLNEVLKATVDGKPRVNDLKTQIEGASLYQDWGTSGDAKKFGNAISGNSNGLWGWGGIAKRVQKQKNYTERADLMETFLDARYNVSLCRYRFAKEQPSKEKQKQLDTCASELVGSASIMSSMPDDKRAKWNELYHDVLQEAGKPVTDLPKFEIAAVEKPAPIPDKEPDVPSTTETPVKTTSQSEPKQAASQPEGTGTGTLVMFALCLLAGLGFVGWVVFNSKKPRQKAKSFGDRPASVSFSGMGADKPLPEFSMPTSAPKPRPKPAPAAAPTAEKPAGTKPAARPATRTEPGAAPKPRPKPPTPPAGS